MSGICGIFSHGWSAADSAWKITGMAEALAHRGPDGCDFHTSHDGRIALAQLRLSLSSGGPASEPMSNAEGTLWIVLDGEIYNHAALRSALQLRGRPCRSESVAETLLDLYELHGIEMLDAVRGPFALAIWDADRKQLVLARDRMGIKPLYYTRTDGRFLFGSEIKALMAHPAVERDLDLDSLYHYLSFSTAPAPGTMFQGIRKLAAGHALLLSEEGGAEEWQWWDAAEASAPDPEHLHSDAAAAAHILDLLSQAVRDQLPGAAPFGIFLSGGIDSSVITALAGRESSAPLRTFSVGYKNAPDHDESARARAVAAHFGSAHEEVLLDTGNLIEYLPQLVHAQDEPLADWVCIPLFYLSQLVREAGIAVALVGEGSDEQFAGYRHYLRYYELEQGLWSAYGRVPGWIRRSLHRSTDPLLRRTRLPREIRELVRRAAMDEPLFLGGAISAWETDKRDLIAPSLHSGAWAGRSSVPLVLRQREHLRHLRPDADFLTEVLYQEMQLRVPELLLMRVDKITMSTSLRARVPFLDHRLVEFSMHLPAAMKIRGGRSKHLLKEAVRGLIPEEVIERRKQGFSAPIKEWFRGPLAGYARRAILDSRLRERALFDYAMIEKLLEAHRSGRRNYDTLLWNLVNLSQWYDCWIAAEPARALDAV